MVTKRTLGISLLLLGLAFVGVFHALASLAFESGLGWIGLALAGLSLLGIILVNTGGGSTE